MTTPLPDTHTFVGVKHLVELGGSHSDVQDSIDCWEPQISHRPEQPGLK